MLFHLAWQATRLPRFRRAYETAFTFALRPPAARWPGRGIRFLVVPRHADGRDGAAYLSEAGDGAPGFDPEYTQVQADMASRLYVVSGDPRALRLSNLLLNTVLSRTDSGWALHTGGGTRKRTLGRQVPLMTPALAVMVFAGGRADLAGRLDGQLARIDREYRGALTYSHRSFYRGLGGQASVIFQAAIQGTSLARGATARRVSPAGVDRAKRRS
jgi:hypothetical protein